MGWEVCVRDEKRESVVGSTNDDLGSPSSTEWQGQLSGASQGSDPKVFQPYKWSDSKSINFLQISFTQERDYTEHKRREPGRTAACTPIYDERCWYPWRSGSSSPAPYGTSSSQPNLTGAAAEQGSEGNQAAAFSLTHLPSVSSTGTPAPHHRGPQRYGLGCLSQRHSTREDCSPSEAGEPSQSLIHCWKATARKGKAGHYPRAI